MHAHSVSTNDCDDILLSAFQTAFSTPNLPKRYATPASVRRTRQSDTAGPSASAPSRLCTSSHRPNVATGDGSRDILQTILRSGGTEPSLSPHSASAREPVPSSDASSDLPATPAVPVTARTPHCAEHAAHGAWKAEYEARIIAWREGTLVQHTHEEWTEGCAEGYEIDAPRRLEKEDSWDAGTAVEAEVWA